MKVRSGDDESHDSPWNPSHVGDCPTRQNEGNSSAGPSSEACGHITRLASIDSFDSKWYLVYPFGFSVARSCRLTPNNSLVLYVSLGNPHVVSVTGKNFWILGNLS